MLMDVDAVQGIARDLKRSAMELNDSAVRVAGSVRGFGQASAGRDYQTQGEQIGQALARLERSLFTWANCTNDCGDALEVCAASCAGVDQATAANLGAVVGAFE